MSVKRRVLIVQTFFAYEPLKKSSQVGRGLRFQFAADACGIVIRAWKEPEVALEIGRKRTVATRLDPGMLVTDGGHQVAWAPRLCNWARNGFLAPVAKTR